MCVVCMFCVYLYLCLCAYLCVFLYTCVCICIFVHQCFVFLRLRVCVSCGHVHSYVCVFVYISACACISVYMYGFMCTCLCICVHSSWASRQGCWGNAGMSACAPHPGSWQRQRRPAGEPCWKVRAPKAVERHTQPPTSPSGSHFRVRATVLSPDKSRSSLK